MTDNIIHELAKKEGDRQWAETEQRLAYSVEYAQAGLKSMFLSNGGAIIALLTFVGNSEAIVEPRALWWSFVWFSCGLACVLAAYILAYLSQSAIMNHAFTESRNADAAAYKTGQKYELTGWAKTGDGIAWGAVVLVCVAFTMFVTGSFVALDAIT